MITFLVKKLSERAFGAFDIPNSCFFRAPAARESSFSYPQHMGQLLDLGALRALKAESGKKIIPRLFPIIPSLFRSVNARNG